MKKLTPLLLLALCGAAAAEDRGLAMMPDGSRDTYVGVALATTNAVTAGEERQILWRPLLQAEWSNGVFVSASGAAGWQLSPTAGVEYGPLLAASNSRDPGSARRLRGSHAISGSWDGGGFFNYYLGDDARLRSNLLYDSSAHGFRLDAGLQKSWHALAPHHTLSLSAGVTLADDAVMRERYEVSRAAGGPRDYTPAGGLQSASAGVNWNWELNSKWLLTSAMTANRLGAQAAGSPVVERRSFLIWSTGLAYRF